MSVGRPSSGNNSLNDRNAALLGETCETIDLTSGDSQDRSFCRIWTAGLMKA